MKLLKNVLACLMMLGLVMGTAGCEPAPSSKPAATTGHDDHGDHDHAEYKTGTMAESLASLKSLHDEIKAAYEKDKPDDAHHALHDIGHVLEALEKQVAALPEDKQAGAKEAVKALFDGYGKLDEGMHGKEGVKYSEIGPTLTTSLQTLESIKP